MTKISNLKFLIALVSLFIFTLSIPQVSNFSVFLIPFIFRFFSFSNWPKYLFKYWPIKMSSYLLFAFSTANYYIVIYVYKLAHIDKPDFRFFTIVFTINILYWMGISLNLRKIPFPRFSILMINLAIFAGGIVFSYLSISKYTRVFSPFNVITIIERRVPNFWYPRGELVGGPFFDMYSYLGLSLIGILIFSLFLLSNSSFYLNEIGNIAKSSKIFSLLFSIIIFLILFLFAFYSSVALGARTPIIVFIFSAFTSFILINFSVVKSRRNITILSLLYAFLVLLVLFLPDLLINTFQSVIASLTDIGIGSRFGVRGMDTPRYELWRTAITQMWNFPFGGRQMSLPGENYVHNIWLDQLYDAGIIPMIFLILFHLSQIPVIVKLIKLNISLLVKIFAICTLIGFMAAFIATPVLQSSYIYFSMSCFFFGSLARLVVDTEKFSSSKC